MKIFFWVPYPKEGASNRYRVEQYLPYLKENGIEYSVSSFWGSSGFKVLYKTGHHFKKCYYFILGTILRFFNLLHIWQYDIVFIHRESCPLGNAFFETILSILKKPFIFDFDDAIFLPSASSQNSFIERFKNPRKIANIIRKSEHVIAGNSHLASFALCYNRSVSIIPTVIDIEKYYPDYHKHGDKIIIGWIGSITTVNFLNILKGTFIELSKRFNHIIFKIVGGNFSIDGIPKIVCKEWTLKDELEDLKTFDIGIMPMPDNGWTKGKCGFKAILYMSMGIPCVCSPVGINKEIITDGINGFLAEGEEEWTKKLLLLIEDEQLRYRIGIAGRKTIEQSYSVKVNAPKFLEIIQKVYCARN